MGFHDTLDDSGDDEYDTDLGNWDRVHNNYSGYRISDQLPLQYYASSLGVPRPSPVKVQAKESVSSPLFCLSSQMLSYHVK